jgi:amino acid transporter
MTDRGSDPSAPDAALARVLGVWALTAYGVSVVVGAGVYVALGEVIARAGPAAPLSFLLAGLAAALTGLCYADLSSRWPHAAGAALFVEKGFRSPLMGRLTGVALTVAVGVAAASIASGAVKFAGAFLPVSPAAALAALILAFTALAAFGVRESAGFAALIGVLEIAGLLAAVVAGLQRAPSYDLSVFAPQGLAQWGGVGAGAFIAFFAFIGFEALANMGEETRDAARAVPRAILGAVAISVVLYALVSAAVVWGGAAGGDNPLLALFTGPAAVVFASVGALAVANGALVEIIMLSRLYFGMARHGRAPAFLARVEPRTRTPVFATLAAGVFVLGVALLIPFERLLTLSNVLTLGVFVAVDLAAMRVARDPCSPPSALRLPAFVAPMAALVCAALALSEFV